MKCVIFIDVWFHIYPWPWLSQNFTLGHGLWFRLIHVSAAPNYYQWGIPDSRIVLSILPLCLVDYNNVPRYYLLLVKILVGLVLPAIQWRWRVISLYFFASVMLLESMHDWRYNPCLRPNIYLGFISNSIFDLLQYHCHGLFQLQLKTDV